jgi:chemotaxis signal transduction protein
MGTETKNYYFILQIDPAAPMEDIERAYRRLAFRYHPDHNSSQEATRIMQEVNEAYNTLRSPAKRAQYDRENRAQWAARKPPGAPPQTSHHTTTCYHPPTSPTPKPTSAPRPVIEQLVTFVLDKHYYSFHVREVEGVIMPPPVFPLNAPSDSIIGSIKTRDGRVGVVDLRRHFSLSAQPITTQNRIILVNFNSIKAGLVVDAIGEILIANENMIQPPPTIITSQNVPFIKAIIHNNGHLFIWLDLMGLFSSEEKAILKKICFMGQTSGNLADQFA